MRCRSLDSAEPSAESRGTLQVRYLAQLSSYVASPLSSVEESMGMLEFLEGPRFVVTPLPIHFAYAHNNESDCAAGLKFLISTRLMRRPAPACCMKQPGEFRNYSPTFADLSIVDAICGSSN